MADKPKAGDVVIMRSGGQWLTVSKVIGKNVEVIWFAGTKIAKGVMPADFLLVLDRDVIEHMIRPVMPQIHISQPEPPPVPDHPPMDDDGIRPYHSHDHKI